MFLKVYIDDGFVGSHYMEEHPNHVTIVFEQVRKSILKINLGKCVFAHRTIELLGYTVSGSGVKAYSEKIGSILEAGSSVLNKEL